MEENEGSEVEQEIIQEESDPIADKWAEIQARMKDEPEEASDPEAEAESSEQQAQRQRDEKGRFAKAETIEQAESETQTAPAITPEGWDINRPPSSLSPQAKAEWDKLPESWRREIHRRETDAHRGIQQIMPDARFGSQIRQIAEPYRAFMESSGATVEGAITGLLRTDALLRTGTPAQKQAAFAQLASHYGIDLGQQVEQTQQAAANYDPRFDQFIAMQQQQEQQRAAVAKQQMESEVGRWLEETDPQGKPLRPFASNVVSELKALIPEVAQANPGASVPQIMEEAYVRAVWANPATRAVLEQQKQAELEATRRAENQRRIEEAKKAASVNVARRGVAPPRPGPMPMDQFIGEQARTLGLLP